MAIDSSTMGDLLTRAEAALRCFLLFLTFVDLELFLPMKE